MSEVKSDWIIDTDKGQAALKDLIKTVQTYNERIGTLEDLNKQAFQKAGKEAKSYHQTLLDGVKVTKQIENSTKSFQAELKRLESEYTKLSKRKKEFAAAGSLDEYNKKIGELKNRMGELDSEIGKGSKSTGGFKSMISGLAMELVAMVSIGAFLALGAQIFSVTAEFQKMEAVLTTSLGSGSAAERSMMMIQDFAAKTPYSVQELTDSYVKLAGRGIRASAKEMEALGDLAASTGKSFDQLTEAALDALSGENERLKEFGIIAKKTGETTQFTFKGVTTEVKNSDDAVKAYLISLGQVEGVAGSMNAVSETLTGRVSNLGDSLDQLFLTLGSQNTGIMGGFITFLTDAITYTTELVATTDQLAKKLAAKDIAEYATKTEADLKKIALAAKANGQSAEDALTKQTETLKKQLAEQLKAADEAAKKVDGYSGGILGFLANPTQYGIEKSVEAGIKSKAEKLKGQIAAIEDAKRFVLQDLQKKEGQEAAEAAEAAKKAAEEAEKKRIAALKKLRADLAKELEALEKMAQKARLDQMNKDSEQYIAEVYAMNLDEIAAIEKSIVAKGKALNKNFKLSAEQGKQLSLLRNGATKEYYASIEALTLKREDELFKLKADSDEKQLEAIRRNYDQQIKEAEKAGNSLLVQALKDAKARELAATGKAQAGKSLDMEEAIAIEGINLDAPSAIGMDADLAAELAKEKEEAILAVQLEYAEKRLALLADSTSQEDQLRSLQLQNTIKGIKEEQAKLREGKDEEFSLLGLLGVKEEDREGVKEAFGEVLSMVTEFTEQQLELANQAVEARKEEVEEKQNELNTEIELNKLGFASNVETKRAELAEAKKQRDQALEEQKKAQKAQMALETINQTIGMVTSSVNVMKGFSAIPIIGVPLGIAAVAAMWAMFISSKAKAAQAAKFEKGGFIGGRRHSQGGNKYQSVDGADIVEIEEGEFITNRKSSKRFARTLEALNDGDQMAAIQTLLEGTGVKLSPDLETPAKLQALRSDYRQQKASGASNSYRKELAGLKKELAAIRLNTGKEQEARTETETHTIIRKGNHTRKVKKQYV